MNYPSRQRGFTIIETLVAITILMISIVGPLTISHKGLLASVYAANQVTASYLAQDAVEYIKNVRDNNLLDSKFWIDGFQNCSQNNPCRVDTILGSPVGADNTAKGVANCDPTAAATNCWLYKSATDVTSRYSHNSALRKTPFQRYFYLASRAGSFNYEARIVVVVSWTNGTIANDIRYENEIFNISK